MPKFKNNAVKAMVVMRKAFRTVDSKTSETFRSLGLTPTQFSVLDVLYAKGEMTIGQLVDNILATSGNMTLVLNNMEKNGWIKRQKSSCDGRAFAISLTDKGTELIEKALPAHISRIEEVFAVLSEDEQEQLISLLKKFRQAR